MTTKHAILSTAATLALVASGACGGTEPSTRQAGNSNAANPAPATAAAPKTEAGPDNSQITTSVDANGQKVTERTFQSGPVEKVTVTSSGGTETARIKYRDGSEVETQDKGTIAKAMEWTGDEVASAGKKTGKAVAGGAETAADKTVDAAGKTVDVTKDAAGKAVDATKDTAGKAADATKKAADKAVDKTTDKAKKLGKKLTP